MATKREDSIHNYLMFNLHIITNLMGVGLGYFSVTFLMSINNTINRNNFFNRKSNIQKNHQIINDTTDAITSRKFPLAWHYKDAVVKLRTNYLQDM